jgi:hypothetical protein
MLVAVCTLSINHFSLFKSLLNSKRNSEASRVNKIGMEKSDFSALDEDFFYWFLAREPEPNNHPKETK